MQDYFDILRDDMLANHRSAHKRMMKIEQGTLNPFPRNLLAGEVNEYYSTILCFDLVRFSELTKTGKDNPNAALLLNTVVPTVMKIITDFTGSLITSSGDEITALFGYEKREASSGAKAGIQAALYMTNFIDHIADRFIGQTLNPGLMCSIGIDQGQIHIASVGRQGMSTLVPLGPPMHIAQNLHFLAGDNEIWVGENVINSLDNDFVDRFFTEASVGAWPWVSVGTQEQYKAYRFIE